MLSHLSPLDTLAGVWLSLQSFLTHMGSATLYLFRLRLLLLYTSQEQCLPLPNTGSLFQTSFLPKRSYWHLLGANRCCPEISPSSGLHGWFCPTQASFLCLMAHRSSSQGHFFFSLNYYTAARCLNVVLLTIKFNFFSTI